MLTNTNTHDIVDLQKKYFPDIHADTIQKRLGAYGLKAYVHCKKPILTKAHISKWLEWAQAHAHWTVEDWMTIIFSDKSKFNLVSSDGCSWCWRRPGEEFDSCF